MISHKYKCIFIHIPKCAGTSIEAALGHFDLYSGYGKQDHRTLAQIQPWSPRHMLSSASLKADARNMYSLLRPQPNPKNRLRVSNKQYQEYFRFSIVRDPWSRALSWYKNVRRDKSHQKRYSQGLGSFRDFMYNYAGKGALRPQTYWLYNRAGELDLHFVGRFEKLAEDFQVIREKIGCPGLELPWLLKGGKANDISADLDEGTDALIRSVYAREIELFSFRSPLK